MLRDYQSHAIALLREHYQDRPCLVLPTGAGKTTVAAEVIRSTVARGNRAVFLVHRRELVDQAHARLREFGILAGRILAGYPERRQRPVQVASIPTLIRRKHWPAELVIVDECAHATSATWRKCLDRYRDSWVIGLTATPVRLDGKGLADLFGCILNPVSTQHLVDQGHLVAPTVYAPPVDLSDVSVRRGDYDLPELADKMSGLTGSITRTWLARAQGLPTVVFAVNIPHSEAIVQAFRDRGVRAAHLDGKMGSNKRDRILRQLKEGQIDMVSNCMVLSEGWDLPALQCAVLARPTKSLALFRQMVGRVMRPPGPVTVLDHAGNHHEHGSVLEDIEWTLEITKEKPPGAPPVRSCPACQLVVSIATVVCPECGAQIGQDAVVPPVDAPGQLVEFKPRIVPVTEKREEYRLMVQEASRRSYRLAWARYRYKDKFRTWPRFRDVEREEYACSGHVWEEKVLPHRVMVRCGRCYLEAQAVEG